MSVPRATSPSRSVLRLKATSAITPIAVLIGLWLGLAAPSVSPVSPAPVAAPPQSPAATP